MILGIIILIFCALLATAGVVKIIDTGQEDKEWHEEHYAELPPFSYIENWALDMTIGTFEIIFGLAIAIVFVPPLLFS